MLAADRAQAIGLVSAVVPREELLTSAKELLRKVTRNGPVAVRLALESVYHALDAATPDALDFESSLFGLLASTSDMKEGMEAFLQKRKPAFRGRCGAHPGGAAATGRQPFKSAGMGGPFPSR
jgi:enoyl-CoA hydratase/carnithine racemase